MRSHCKVTLHVAIGHDVHVHELCQAYHTDQGDSDDDDDDSVGCL